MSIPASLIIPSRNRPDAVTETLRAVLAGPRVSAVEIIVVDDGSLPALSLNFREIRLIRTGGVERSRARNRGALAAQGELLIFLDDDMTVGPTFLAEHIAANLAFPGALCVGGVALPANAKKSPFGRFRHLIEDPSQSHPRGPVTDSNFCTAQNMSVRRGLFLALGGFDPAIVSGEDQDFALRFCANGGHIAFVPEAEAVHRDSAMDVFSYCRRHQWGARAMAPFLRRYPEREDSKTRLRFQEGHVARKVLSSPPVLAALRLAVSCFERGNVGDTVLFPMYRLLLGLHLFRGFRDGLSDVSMAPSLPTPLVREDS